MIAFVRHGQTAVNRAGLLQGRVDAPLTDAGRAQAEQLAARFASTRVVCVYASPLQRALETAVVIADCHGLAVEVDERLVELDYGAWDQRAVADILPQEWEHWRGDPAFTPPGGESLQDVTSRVGAFCAALLGGGSAGSGGDETVVAVSHVSPIKAAVCWALGVDESVSWRLHLDLASITLVSQRAGRSFLQTYNDTAHLV